MDNGEKEGKGCPGPTRGPCNVSPQKDFFWQWLTWVVPE